MKAEQPELRVVDPLFKELSVRLVPNGFLHGAVFDELDIADERDAVAAKVIAYTRLRVILELHRLAVFP